MTQQRAVCLNCIDGRVQLPVIRWITDQHPVDYVDMVTEPGMDGFLAAGGNDIAGVIRKVKISVEKNNAAFVFVTGHHDCKGNPVDDAAHKQHIQQAADRIKDEFPHLAVTGLWINSAWECEALYTRTFRDKP